MIRARFRMALPPDVWVHDVSTSFPDATLRLLTGVPRGDRALELGEVRSRAAPTVADAIRTHPDVFGYEELYADADRVGVDEVMIQHSVPDHDDALRSHALLADGVGLEGS